MCTVACVISDEELGRRLAAARAYRGYHQKDIAALAEALGHPRGFSVSMVSQFETGRRDYGTDRRSVRVLCDIYEFDYDLLVDPATKIFAQTSLGVVETLTARMDAVTEVVSDVAAQVAEVRLGRSANERTRKEDPPVDLPGD